MAKSLEDIVGKITRKPVLPGTRPEEADEVRYVSFARPAKPSEVWDDVVWKVDPPLVKNGGVSLPNWIVTIPDATPFYALEYNGDVAKWQSQIERGAELSGLLSAKIEDERFIVSDGRSYPLSECVADFEPEFSKS